MPVYIHTYTSRFMEIQQKDFEILTAYIHRFKKEAKHCDFDSHPAKIRIFLKGLINSSRITPSVYKKGPTTIEDTINIFEKISSAQRIAASFSQNHQISMMKRGRNEHHAPEHHHAPTHHQSINQDCSNCGQIGHPWFTCPRIICDGCNQCGHIYRHCWERIPPSGTSSPPDNHHSRGRRPLHPQYPANRRDDRRSQSRSNVRIHQRDRSTSHSRHPSTDRHASRDRNTGQRHTPDCHRIQSRSPHRQRLSNNRPPTLCTRHNSRSRSSSRNNEKPHRCSMTIQDNPADNDDQEYDNVDDYFDEDLN